MNENKQNISNITIESTKEDVAFFIFNKYKKDIENIKDIYNNIIKENISGEILLDLEKYNEYMSLGIQESLKEKLKKYLEDNKERFIRKPIEITIGFNSKNDEIKDFFKNYLSYEGQINNINNIDGKKMLNLSYEDMKKIGLNIGQRIKLNNYILYTINHITDKSTKEEVGIFFNKILNLSDKTIEKLNFDGKSLLSCKEEDIDQLRELNQEQKAKLRHFLNKIEIDKQFDKDIEDQMNNKQNKQIYKIKDVSNNIANNNNNNDNNKKKEGQLNGKEEAKNKKVENFEIYKKCNYLDRQLESLYEYKIHPINSISDYNVFFIFNITEKKIDNSNILIFLDNNNFKFFLSSKKKYIVFKHKLIYHQKIKKEFEDVRYIMVQVPIIKNLDKLSIYAAISDKDGLSKYENTIKIEPNKANYFYINNLYFNNGKYFPIITDNEIYSCYLDFYFKLDNDKDQKENIKKDLIKCLINNINNSKKIDLNADNILKLFKLCLDLNIAPENINSIEIIDANIELNKNYYLSYKDFNSPIFSNVKQSIIKLITKIYAKYDKEFLVELILVKDNKDVYRNVLDLLNKKLLNYSIFKFNNGEDLVRIQNNLISISKTIKEIENILKISKGIINYLKVIKDNYDKIISILESNEKKDNLKNYCFTLAELAKNESIDIINDLFVEIIKIINKKNGYYNIIDFSSIFNNLINSSNTLDELYKINTIIEKFKSKFY